MNEWFKTKPIWCNTRSSYRMAYYYSWSCDLTWDYGHSLLHSSCSSSSSSVHKGHYMDELWFTGTNSFIGSCVCVTLKFPFMSLLCPFVWRSFILSTVVMSAESLLRPTSDKNDGLTGKEYLLNNFKSTSFAPLQPVIAEIIIPIVIVRRKPTTVT